MKKFTSVCLLCILGSYTFAQKVNTDSLTYQLQRAKINQMLDVRKQKFGWYDQSLSKHTGIFGLQTKKDIRRSNEILMDIVKTDDDLFREIKILMDYRIFQQQQVQSHSMETENVNLGFMNTINRLRQQIDQLKQDAQKEKEHQVGILRTFIILFVLMLGSILYLLLKKRAVKA
ncbi:MAG: hypothetical protein JWR54_855 [Mucilaginibacter sp.]|jgi:hypothetical protein|nr:hypothetical protein [Mucilaginibacter sp.]